MDSVNLTGHFLIAMPAMADPHFSKSVTFICEHNAHGAMGILINRPIEMNLEDIFLQINLEVRDKQRARESVYFGGPVHVDRGFVLHNPVGQWQSSLMINDDTALTTSRDILEAAATGNGPQKMLVSLGYAGWSAGQLEQELAQNAWLTVPAQQAVIFDLPNEQKLHAAMNLLGIDFARLSDGVGHA
ncbi:MAG: YqgE/AlgH family protein [Methylobacillus sp.]|nr:YqgE/AlgH family protein [Methylobacillus sp.]